MSDRDIDVERICQAALDRAPAERAALLAEECRDDEELRRDVEALLALEPAADQFIEIPALLVARQQPSDADKGRDAGLPPGSSEWESGAMIRPGSRVGPYEILCAVGAGGMGEVYRARDTRLLRDVAVKMLPQALALDPDRVRRFRREAQVLASLNHPNIASIHGLEEAGGIRALILEFVEGPTLADRVARGPIPLDEALVIARQIAEAIEAAHEKGVVHRDLKPANITLRPDGTVKVLDFGLAKMFETQPPDASVSGSPKAPASVPGMLLGTPAYMAPEQAKGQDTDRRADVWAFGCVLFEMLAGRTAFAGDTSGEILADVLKTDPDWRLVARRDAAGDSAPATPMPAEGSAVPPARHGGRPHRSRGGVEPAAHRPSDWTGRSAGTRTFRLDFSGVSCGRSRRHCDVGIARRASERCRARDARRNHHAPHNRSDVARDLS